MANRTIFIILRVATNATEMCKVRWKDIEKPYRNNLFYANMKTNTLKRTLDDMHVDIGNTGMALSVLDCMYRTDCHGTQWDYRSIALYGHSMRSLHGDICRPSHPPLYTKNKITLSSILCGVRI